MQARGPSRKKNNFFVANASDEDAFLLDNELPYERVVLSCESANGFFLLICHLESLESYTFVFLLP